MAGPRLEIVVRVPEKIHARLAELADDRDQSLEHFCAELLEVAAVEQRQEFRAEAYHHRPDPLA